MPDSLTLDVLRARFGDCLLLRHGDDLMLIDGGPKGVYDESLKPRLEQLIAERGAPLRLRMVMVSHIDDDHIVGLADMFEDVVDAQDEHRPALQWRAGELWLNSFAKVTGGAAKPDSTGAAQSAAVDALVAEVAGAESEAIAVSIPNGNRLVRDAGALDIKLNQSVGGGLVECRDAKTTLEIAPGLTFTVLAPAANRLEKLRKKWEAFNAKHPDAEPAANVDQSVFNLSSIVVLAEAGGKRALLTGDARSDDILHGLEISGLQMNKSDPPLKVDLLKLPHHGSIRNVDAEFFARVHARNYVISADGTNGNPEDATLKLLCDSRTKDDEPWTLWLTYGGAAGDGKPDLHGRLAKFFAARPDVDVKFAAPGTHHTIAL
jgi:Metallo-beta-lactamase superfamily